MRILDPLFTKIGEECEPEGGGNTHHRMQFKAGLDGTHYLEVIPNNQDLAGNYKIRLLPHNFDTPQDPNTHEPNNVKVNAYPIAIGPENAITSTIEERNISYSTNGSDRDWYRIDLFRFGADRLRSVSYSHNHPMPPPGEQPPQPTGV